MKDYFEEIIGNEDIKRELRIISDMLNNTEIYRNLGAGINEGVILSGRPGTGKTTMANCLIRSTNRKSYTIRKKDADAKYEKIIMDYECKEISVDGPDWVDADETCPFLGREEK